VTRFLRGLAIVGCIIAGRAFSVDLQDVVFKAIGIDKPLRQACEKNLMASRVPLGQAIPNIPNTSAQEIRDYLRSPDPTVRDYFVKIAGRVMPRAGLLSKSFFLLADQLSPADPSQLLFGEYRVTSQHSNSDHFAYFVEVSRAQGLPFFKVKTERLNHALRQAEELMVLLLYIDVLVTGAINRHTRAVSPERNLLVNEVLMPIRFALAHVKNEEHRMQVELHFRTNGAWVSCY
jgi:hypothetical protein